MGRSILQVAYNRLEPDDPQQMPQLMRHGRSDYRRNRKTRTTIATLFGRVCLRRFIYQAVEAGEAGIFPLQIALGVTAGQATLALADVVALVVGRDGVMIPMRREWEEACTASLTVDDSTGKRWATTYLGHMPEAGHETMTRQLT